jgi:hypothetical protein
MIFGAELNNQDTRNNDPKSTKFQETINKPREKADGQFDNRRSGLRVEGEWDNLKGSTEQKIRQDHPIEKRDPGIRMKGKQQPGGEFGFDFTKTYIFASWGEF